MFDNEKTGKILDSQQRMWALDLLNLERTFIQSKPPIPFYGPASIIIGDFKNDPDYELENLRMYFITSNETKNLPSTLKQELASLLNSEIKDALPSKTKYKRHINKIVDLIDEDHMNPFYKEVDHESKSFNKLGEKINIEGKEIRLFSRRGLYNLINTIIKGNPFNYNEKDLELFKINIERWLDIIIDFFNAFKCVFYEDWFDNDSIIRRNVGINAIGMLIALIWSHHYNSMSREERVKELVGDFAKWKDFDEKLDFSRNSIYNSMFKKELKEYIIEIYRKIQESWQKSTIEAVISEDVKEIISESLARWDKIKDSAEKIKDKKILDLRKK